MEINTLVLGDLDTNCYVLEIDNDVLIIDPASDSLVIENFIKNKNLLGIIITHHHFDHVGALNDLTSKYAVNVYDINNLEEKEYNIANFKFKVLYTNGHTSDSITIYFEKEKVMFTGDFLFRGSIGRTDLGGNDKDMKDSIDKIKKYSDITIYPGHGLSTTIDYEKENNYYLK